ncbi:MAG: alpha/beta fold hydrolase [Candidatus Limnocylindrales bacterium]
MSDGTRAPGGYVDAGGVHTYYEVQGSGEPLILLHGGFATIETWQGQAPVFAERYRVYLPERRGHGRTPDVAGPMGYAIMARDTIAFMETLGIGPAHIVGWSDGGYVATELALARPDLVRRLVLIGAAANAEGYTAETRESNEHLTPESLPPFVRKAYDRLSPDGPEHFPVVFNKLAAVWRTEPDHPLTDLGALTMPTLLLLGDHDDFTIEHAAAMLQAIPRGELAVVPGASHALLFEKRDLANRLILDFLTEAEG